MVKKEELKEVRYSTKVVITLFIWFNIGFIGAILSLKSEDLVFGFGNPMWWWFLVYNVSMLGVIFGFEKPKSAAGLVAIGQEFKNQFVKVKDTVFSVGNLVGGLKGVELKTELDKFPKEKPDPEPLPSKEGATEAVIEEIKKIDMIEELRDI